MSTLHEDPCTFIIISRWILLRIEYVSAKVVEMIWKNMVEPEMPQMIQYGTCAMHAGLIRLHTRRMCNTYCISATTMVSWTRLVVTLYLHCYSCSEVQVIVIWRKIELKKHFTILYSDCIYKEPVELVSSPSLRHGQGDRFCSLLESGLCTEM